MEVMILPPAINLNFSGGKYNQFVGHKSSSFWFRNQETTTAVTAGEMVHMSQLVKKVAIATATGPKALGAYSPAILGEGGKTLFVSGQLGLQVTS